MEPSPICGHSALVDEFPQEKNIQQGFDTKLHVHYYQGLRNGDETPLFFSKRYGLHYFHPLLISC